MSTEPAAPVLKAADWAQPARLLTAGISVLPANTRTKQPQFAALPRAINPKTGEIGATWDPFRRQYATIEETRRWPEQGADIVALVTGNLSRVEGHDVDLKGDRAHLAQRYLDQVKDQDPGLFQRLVIYRSKSGGLHIPIRYKGEIPGNQVWAYLYTPHETDPTKVNRQPLIESRGEGGYLVYWPMVGCEVLQGDPTDPPMLTAGERDILIDVARDFEEGTEHLHAAAAAAKARRQEHIGGRNSTFAGPRPGDVYNEKATLADVASLLRKEGATVRPWRSGNGADVTRPGKDPRHGSSGNIRMINRTPFLVQFSSSWSTFEPAKGYDAFAVYANVEHGGDFTAAAKALYREQQASQNGHASTGAYEATDDAGHEQDSASAKEKLPKADLLDAGHMLAQQHQDDLAFDGRRGAYRRYTGTHWQEIDRGSHELDPFATEALRATRQQVSSATKVDGCIRLAIPYCTRVFEPAPGLVNFANGTLSVATFTLRLHDRADNLTSCTPYSYRPGPYPRIAAFLREAIPDPCGQRCYKTHIGLALIEDRRFHKAVILLGPPRTGKSVLERLATATVGDNPGGAGAILFSPEIEGMRSRFRWSTRRLVTLEELPPDALRSEELVKAMIAHDPVSMRGMFRAEPNDNIWAPKLMMSTNEAPRYSDRSSALTVRFCFIICPNSRQEPEDGTVHDQATQQDLYLTEKLFPEVPAFAVACIQEAMEALSAGHYPESLAMRRERERIERRGDALKAWSADYLCLDAASWTPTAQLYSAYVTYCREAGSQALGRERFNQALCQRYKVIRPKVGRIDVFEGGREDRKQIRGLAGIRFRTDDDPPIDDESADPGDAAKGAQPVTRVTRPDPADTREANSACDACDGVVTRQNGSVSHHATREETPPCDTCDTFFPNIALEKIDLAVEGVEVREYSNNGDLRVTPVTRVTSLAGADLERGWV